MSNIPACHLSKWSRVIASACMVFGVLTEGCHRVADKEAAKPVVPVARVKRADLENELSFQAELRPKYAVDLHAKVAGFVRTLAVDIGDRVTAGQILAELEVPLLHEDINRAAALLHRSEEDVRRAKAGFDEAHLTFTRLEAVLKNQPRLIAQQDLDLATEKDSTASAALAGAEQQVQVAQAELNRYREQENDCKLAAPFAGVVTRLDASPGDLVLGGVSPSGQARALVRLSEIDSLRLSFPVSVTYVSEIKVGDAIEVRFDGGKTLNAKVARMSHEVQMATRTMEVEADIPNPDLALVPGMYATAVVHPIHHSAALIIPAEALNRKTGSYSVFAVSADGLVDERVVRLGLETPTKIEIVSGLKEGEWVVTGGAGRVKAGQKVEPHDSGALALNTQ